LYAGTIRSNSASNVELEGHIFHEGKDAMFELQGRSH